MCVCVWGGGGGDGAGGLATLKGKDIVLFGSSFFPLRIAPFF